MASLSGRVFNAPSLSSIVPDVPRLATFLVPLARPQPATLQYLQIALMLPSLLYNQKPETRNPFQLELNGL
jgi:hypothetical protein